MHEDSDSLLTNKSTFKNYQGFKNLTSLLLFSIAKFQEALSWVGQYLRDHKDELVDTHLMLMGDFNFPKEIVEWRGSSMDDC